MCNLSYPKFKNDLQNILEPECNRCLGLVRNRKKISWGYGYLNSKIIFIAEAPAKGDPKENEWQGSNYTGIPFTNLNSGKLFRSHIKKIGFDLANDFYITNTVKCLSTKLNAEIKNNCAEHLKKEIKMIQPQLIVCVGGTALKEVYKIVTGKNNSPTLGSVIKKGVIELLDHKITAMIHPAYFNVWLKNYGFKNEEEYLNLYRSIFNQHLI